MRRSLPLLGFALLLCAVGLIAFAATTPAAATEEYQRTLNQPCISCHPGGNGTDLNARGRAFAAVANHKADPRAAWATAVEAFPLPPRSEDRASVLVPIAVFALLAVWLYTVVRRRRAAS